MSQNLKRDDVTFIDHALSALEICATGSKTGKKLEAQIY